MSNTAKHTPGPWAVNVRTVWGESRVIANTTTGAGVSDNQDEANARLIAAAPDLLELLTELYERNQIKVFIPLEVSKRMKAAIAKATGQ